MPDITGSSVNLSAAYESPTGHKVFTHSIPSQHNKDEAPLDVATKTKYLSNLWASTKELQEGINQFLTQKMEEDKNTVGRGANGASKQKSKDELEEENYGEENADDET